MNTLRVGVIGAGAFAETCHVPGLQSHPQAEVVVLCGRDESRTRAMAQRLGVPETSLDYEGLCARPDIDAVTIATPNALHARQALAAFAAGKHVFCEKPLGMNVEEAASMLRAAAQSQKNHQVAFTYRYLYGVQELKRRLLNGEIGDPYYVSVYYDSWDGMKPNATIGFREQLGAAGGGVLYDVGSHLFDIVGFVLGPIDAVSGSTVLFPRERSDPRTGAFTPVETDDIASASFICRNGVQGQLFASRVTPDSGEKAYIKVVGQRGALKASLSRGAVDVLKVSRPAQPAWEVVPLPEEASVGRPHCLARMMRSFVEACLHGRMNSEVDASFVDGYAVQQALSAVRDSAAQQHWIHLK
mgnify:CR=1 FL=1